MNTTFGPTWLFLVLRLGALVNGIPGNFLSFKHSLAPGEVEKAPAKLKVQIHDRQLQFCGDLVELPGLPSAGWTRDEDEFVVRGLRPANEIHELRKENVSHTAPPFR